MPPYSPLCFIGVLVINCWAVSAQPCIIFSTPGIFLLWPRYCLPVRRNSSLLVRKRDWSLNNYFIEKPVVTLGWSEWAFSSYRADALFICICLLGWLHWDSVQFSMAIFGCYTNHLCLVYFSHSQCVVHYVQVGTVPLDYINTSLNGYIWFQLFLV